MRRMIVFIVIVILYKLTSSGPSYGFEAYDVEFWPAGEGVEISCPPGCGTAKVWVQARGFLHRSEVDRGEVYGRLVVPGVFRDTLLIQVEQPIAYGLKAGQWVQFQWEFTLHCNNNCHIEGWKVPVNYLYFFVDAHGNVATRRGDIQTHHITTGDSGEEEVKLEVEFFDGGDNYSESRGDFWARCTKLAVTADEGSEVTFKAISSGITIGQQIEWDFGDGQKEAAKLETSHIYTDDGLYTTTFAATTTEGSLIAEESLVVKVNNVAPQVEIGPDQVVEEGEEFSIPISFYDPGLEDAFEVQLDCHGLTTAYAPVQGSGFEVQAKKRWDDLPEPIDDGYLWRYLVENTNPDDTRKLTDFEITFGPGFDATDGNCVWGPGVVDPNGDSWNVDLTTNSITWTVNGGGLSPGQTAAFCFWTEQVGEKPDAVEIRASFGSEHQWEGKIPAPGPYAKMGISPNIPADAHERYGDNGSYIVELKVIDDDDGVGTDTLTMTVTNVKPSVSMDGASGGMVAGSAITFSGKYTDPGWLDTHRVTWDFGDGGLGITGEQVDSHEGYYPEARGTSKITHTYKSKGVFTVTLTVTDDDGGVGVSTTSVAISEAVLIRTLSITSIDTSPGATANVQLSISDAAGITSGDIQIQYDVSLITVDKVKATQLISGMSLIVNTDTPGEVVLALAGSEAIPSEKSGAMVDLELMISAEAKPGTKTELKFGDEVSLYDQAAAAIPISLKNGVVNIIGIKGDVNRDGKVRSNDAYLALRIAVGKITPSDYEKWAADMNDDGEVEANDAIKILRQAAGLPAPPVDLLAAGTPITLALGEAHGIAGQDIMLPLRVDATRGLAGGDIWITYDSTVLHATEVSSSSDMLLASNTDASGVVRISFASTDALVSRTLAEIHFRVLADDVSQLALEKADLYQPDALPLESRSMNGYFSSWLVPPVFSALLQNFPNPFNPDTWVPYQLKEGSDVLVRIFNAKGELIRHLDLKYRSAGLYVSRDRAAYWDGRNEAGEQVASGVYFYTIQAGDFIATKKMVVAK